MAKIEIKEKPGYTLEDAQAIARLASDPVVFGLANTIISLHAANGLLTEMIEKADADALAFSTKLHAARAASEAL